MEDESRNLFGIIILAIFSNATAQNLSLLPTISLAQTCTASDGTTYYVGDEWMSSPSTSCRCVAPLAIQCMLNLRCVDSRGNVRNPGDQWLESPTVKCDCHRGNLTACTILEQPICMDNNGNFKKDGEIWTNGSCVHCTCILGRINCTGYHVNISYGLYKVNSYPTCEGCDLASRTLDALSSCEAYHVLSAKEKLFQCASGGSFIQESRQCNGIYECSDKSDENDCENAVCRDNEDGVYFIKDVKGWPVSQCMKCHCRGGLLTCRRTFRINFPGYFFGVYTQYEYCIQPSCNVAKFIRENGDDCEGVEFFQDKGIYLKGQTWKSEGCQFLFPGTISDPRKVCPAMTRPDCYVYNGAVCCASECPALQQVADQLRANLTLCPGGRQLVSDDLKCNQAAHCMNNSHLQNCSSEVTCRDEDSIQYFEGATWSVGNCIKCSCTHGKIRCTRELLLVSFLQLKRKKLVVISNEPNFSEKCEQFECNVANFMKNNNGVCKACRWNGKLYYDGDHWAQNGVDFYCSSSVLQVRPGCYVSNSKATCTGAISGLRQLSLISKDDLFLCESGDEIRSLGDRCNVKIDCADHSDERNCNQYYCATEESHGFLWVRAQVGSETLKSCAVANSSWAGIFGSKCMMPDYTIWQHLSTCTCERKSTLESFRNKFANLNDSNFLNVSNDLATAAKNGEFTNIRVFHELFKDLFYNVTRLLTPLTVKNAGKALQYCQHFIKTLQSSPIYERKTSFCGRPKLVPDRINHIDKALQFLLQAPNNTKAHHFGTTRSTPFPEDTESYSAQPYVVNNLRSIETEFSAVIWRPELSLQLNTAQLLPREVEKPISVPVDNRNTTNNMTTANVTKANNTSAADGNVELTDEEISDLLQANNCTSLKFDEEVGAVVYNKDTLNEYQKHIEFQINMELVLMCISTAAVFVALILLAALKLKSSEKLFIHKSLLLSLGLGNLVYIMDKTLFDTREKHTALCTFVTVIQYFFHTAIFTWMLVEGINLYIKLVKVFSAKKQYVAYVALGWGIPIVITGLVASISPSTFDMGKPSYTDISCGALQLTARNERRRCWIKGSVWIYKGPILGILVANTVLFVILLRVIFGKISTRYGGDNVQATKKGIRSTVALLPLLGVTWLVGFFVELHQAVAYIFILLNSSQGTVFFIFHCVLDQEVQDAARKLFGQRSVEQPKTRSTLVSNRDDTPEMERHSVVKLLQESRRIEADDSIMNTGKKINESSI